ncbi:nucleotidyltransferase domain-containing protein [Paraliomyxa miuraensis]|uniref:nucleotidyltransferase domain-containing protein n=1 Tax=Paraliomyxa miuraensis TaxID=376150 RepID=UPI00225BE1C3|nr:nucleotidyltransferase domain-containing protein [Paraliomyxa miuraensis]MCX4243401.1 nucleotidyltransferase domain-containing protein [Paraliomyxa miuraensis]
MKPITDPHQLAIAERVLDQEGEARRHLVVHLSGAHAYGFPSPDSDLDLKAIHVERTEALLGLSLPNPTRNRLEVIEGVEIDYTSNELQVAVRGILRGDGNMIERVLATAPLRDSSWRPALAELTRKNLSRKVHHHYRGFAWSQRKAMEEAAAARGASAKKALYVLRTALTGTHLLQTGECEPDLTRLCDDYGVSIVPALVEIKQQGEREPLPPALATALGPTIDRVFARLDEAREASPLPEEPAHVDALEHWLVGVRRADL